MDYGKIKIQLFIYLGVLLLILPKITYAYLDPGTGSYLLQIIAASFFAALFLMKGWFKGLRNFFLKIFRKDKKIIDEAPEEK